AQPGQEQHRRLVDLHLHLRHAGHHAAAADLHGRRAARRTGPKEAMSATPAMPASTAPLLQVQNLRVSFGGKEVVHGVSFDVRPGEKLALVGESGSGKTVTALSLLRLAGDAQVEGRALMQG